MQNVRSCKQTTDVTLPHAQIKTCVPNCTTNEDCATPEAGSLYDADNYVCESGACVYQGCNTDDECEQSLGARASCVDLQSTGQRSCLKRCSDTSDCATPEAGPAYDADNYRCDEALCIYAGCNNDSECAETLDGMACIKP